MSKLTLSMNETTIAKAKAKKLAAEKGTSVSAMFSKYIQAMSRRRDTREARISPLVKRVSGIISLDSEKQKKVLTDALMEKYRVK